MGVFLSISFVEEAAQRREVVDSEEEEMLSRSYKKSQVTHFWALALIFSRKEREIIFSLAMKKAVCFTLQLDGGPLKIWVK